MPSKPQLEQIIESQMEFIVQLEDQAHQDRAILTQVQALLRVGSYAEILPKLTRILEDMEKRR